jgi:hypothetical protein
MDAVAVDPYTGDAYFGSTFTTIGGVAANGIARWDGSGWHALGSGLEYQDNANLSKGSAHDIAFASNGDVYACGFFDEAGGVAVNNIARWDGSDWHALGSGIDNGWNCSLSINGSDVYVGGEYIASAGGQSTDRVARWDGSSWHTYSDISRSEGVNGYVSTVLYDPAGLIVGGQRGIIQLTPEYAHRVFSGGNWNTQKTATQEQYDEARVINAGSDTIYMLAGNGSSTFYKYSATGDSWDKKAGLPENASNAAMSLGPDGDLFVLVDSGGFYRYNSDDNSWAAQTAVPTTTAVLGEGLSLAWNGDNETFYALVGGNGKGVLRYNTANSQWDKLTGSGETPAQVVDGAGLVTANGKIYASPGGSSTAFWQLTTPPPAG